MLREFIGSLDETKTPPIMAPGRSPAIEGLRIPWRGPFGPAPPQPGYDLPEEGRSILLARSTAILPSLPSALVAQRPYRNSTLLVGRAIF
jgi:hypothetical protein